MPGWLATRRPTGLSVRLLGEPALDLRADHRDSSAERGRLGEALEGRRELFVGHLETARIAWAGSGPGMIPSQRAKRTAASNAAVCAIARASTSSALTSAERLGASPW